MLVLLVLGWRGRRLWLWLLCGCCILAAQWLRERETQICRFKREYEYEYEYELGMNETAYGTERQTRRRYEETGMRERRMRTCGERCARDGARRGSRCRVGLGGTWSVYY